VGFGAGGPGKSESSAANSKRGKSRGSPGPEFGIGRARGDELGTPGSGVSLDQRRDERRLLKLGLLVAANP
jgi:hypothetical protein